MEDLEKVIDALQRCLDGDEACPGCYLNDYAGCRDKLNLDALDHLVVYRDFLQRCGEGGELIRRSDLLKFPIRRDHCDKENANPHFINGIEPVMEYAEFIPPVEAEPVVHAHWNPTETPGMWQCSACKFPDLQPEFRLWCSYCGAYMDEEVADGK